MWRWSRCVLVLAPIMLPACAAHPGGAYSVAGGAIPLDCAPFARALSGLQLRGAAASWWAQAAGRYERSQHPQIGSVLVFRRSARLPSGHVGVVSELVSDREILMTQANWVHRRITEDQPVIDISPGHDWTLVRVWWPPSDQLGATAYATDGFIRPAQPATHEQIASATPQAAHAAVSR